VLRPNGQGVFRGERQIGSIFQVLEIGAADFIWIGSVLRHLVVESSANEGFFPMEESYRKSVAPMLGEVAARCKLIELPICEKTTLHWQNEFHTVATRTYLEGRCAIEEIERTFINELADKSIYYIPKDRAAEGARMLEEVRELWPEPWPIALDNLDSARYCYRFDEHTASVFHSMRAVEPILTALARSLTGVDPSREQWQTLIERTEAAIKDMDQLPKTPDRDRKQTAYSEVAMQFRFIKNAWRNHVMHSRGDYKERDAREIWWHVKRSLEKTIKELPSLQETPASTPGGPVTVPSP
jgi:hypothetical protein